MIDHTWTPVPASETLTEDDQAFWTDMGYELETCPTCGAHVRKTKDGSVICLNACHLTSDSQRRFAAFMRLGR